MILITGTTGKVGLHVSRALAGRDDVRALAHADHSAETLKDLGHTDVVRGGLDAPPAGLFDGVNAVFLLTPGGPDQRAQETGAIDLAVAAGVRRIVKLSAREALHPEGQPYVQNIVAVEEHLRRSGVPATILRPDHFLDNLLLQAEPIAAGQVVYPGGNGALAWIDPRDIAAAAVAALTADEPVVGTIELSGPQVLTFDQLAAELSAGLGRDVASLDVPNEAWRAALTDAGIPAPNVKLLGEMFASISARPHPVLADGVQRLTGREPIAAAEWAREILLPALESEGATLRA